MRHRRSRLLIVAGLGAFATSACSSDPALWDAMAAGLVQAADEMAWENANCYWGPMPGGERYGPQRRYCPGDYGYAPPVALPASYYRRELRRHDRERDRDSYRDGYRDGYHRRDHGSEKDDHGRSRDDDAD